MGVMAEVMGVRMESKKRCSFERIIRSYGRWMGGAATYHLIKAIYLEAATIFYSALLASTRSPLAIRRSILTMYHRVQLGYTHYYFVHFKHQSMQCLAQLDK